MGISLPLTGLMARTPSSLHAGLFLGKLGTLKVGLGGGSADIGLHLVQIGELVRPLGHTGMLRGDDHIGCTKQGVATGWCRRSARRPR